MVIIRSIQIIATRATRIRPARWVWPTRRPPAGRFRQQGQQGGFGQQGQQGGFGQQGQQGGFGQQGRQGQG